MSRQRIKEVPLTNAEKQARFRAKQKAKMEALEAAVQSPAQPVMAAPSKEELAQRADQNYDQGRVIGLCEAASFFIGKDRTDIAQSLLSHFMIDREKAATALQTDKRTKSLTLETLDKSKAWGQTSTHNKVT